VGLFQRAADLWEDKAKRARLLLWFTLLSTGFLVFGFILILIKVFLEK